MILRSLLIEATPYVFYCMVLCVFYGMLLCVCESFLDGEDYLDSLYLYLHHYLHYSTAESLMYSTAWSCVYKEICILLHFIVCLMYSTAWHRVY